VEQGCSFGNFSDPPPGTSGSSRDYDRSVIAVVGDLDADILRPLRIDVPCGTSTVIPEVQGRHPFRQNRFPYGHFCSRWWRSKSSGTSKMNRLRRASRRPSASGQIVPPIMLSHTPGSDRRPPAGPSPPSIRPDDRLQPPRPLAARRALARTTRGRRMYEDRESPHHAGPFRNDDHPPDPPSSRSSPSTRCRTTRSDLVGPQARAWTTRRENGTGLSSLCVP